MIKKYTGKHIQTDSPELQSRLSKGYEVKMTEEEEKSLHQTCQRWKKWYDHHHKVLEGKEKLLQTARREKGDNKLVDTEETVDHPDDENYIDTAATRTYLE